ncbi:MAG: formate dehydrogenase accessory sulfurtransferase FdhD [Tissierellia bacterium]|nr:formate dehydrogenase accessory sulfurtransferase FdhD [Tissierellia bacterium]
MLRADTAIILAGGMSKRMGFSKETMDFRGAPLMDQLIEELSLSFDQIIVVSKNQSLYEDKDHVITTFDKYEGRGPLAGLHAGLSICKSDFAYLIACDMPFINHDYIDFLKEKLDDKTRVLVANIQGKIEPFNGFYKLDLVDQIERALLEDQRSMNKFIRGLSNVSYIKEEQIRRFSPDLSIFSNMNTPRDLMVHQENKLSDETHTVMIERFNNAGARELLDKVINEYPLTLFVNGQELCTFLASPKSLDYLVIGYLFINGYIRSYSDIKSLEIDLKNGLCYVEIDLSSFEKGDRKRAFDQEGLAMRPEFRIKDLDLKPIESSKISISFETISFMSKKFEHISKLFEDTGGAHSCALIRGQSFVFFEEDVARNNCIDKMVGRIVKDDLDLSDMVLMTSCRISAEIMIKIIRSGIRAIVSVAAVTSLAIDLAKKYNVFLVGFSRGDRLNLYNKSFFTLTKES